ncbi:MAG TPA: RHS repeat-associated core domain-containing protein, partial [Thermoguttaceae bacterium]
MANYAIVHVFFQGSAFGAWWTASVERTGGPPPSADDLPVVHFTGREWDADAGLYYYRARWYDANTGQFLSEDPLGFAAG